MNVNIKKTQIFKGSIYNLKVYKASFLLKSFWDFYLLFNFNANFMIASIMKTQIFHKIKYDLTGHFYVMERFFAFSSDFLT